jgi:hypothetical protein
MTPGMTPSDRSPRHHNAQLAINSKVCSAYPAQCAHSFEDRCSRIQELRPVCRRGARIKNLGIPFDLEAKMTGSNAVSLGKAIQQLKPDADSKAKRR